MLLLISLARSDIFFKGGLFVVIKNISGGTQKNYGIHALETFFRDFYRVLLSYHLEVVGGRQFIYGYNTIVDGFMVPTRRLGHQKHLELFLCKNRI